jgi:hypothetical protein
LCVCYFESMSQEKRPVTPDAILQSLKEFPVGSEASLDLPMQKHTGEIIEAVMAIEKTAADTYIVRVEGDGKELGTVTNLDGIRQVLKPD